MPLYTPNETIQQAILAALGDRVGSDRSTTRMGLLAKVNLIIRQHHQNSISERQLRSSIEWLRMNDPTGARICSPFSGGYFLARDFSELDDNLAGAQAMATHILERVKKQRAIVKFQESGQIRLPL